jgi:NADP-dependent 3-hydroxy acid dehydrogenase YdfG
MKRLRRNITLITGAARGIGAAVAELSACEGTRLLTNFFFV